MKYIEIEKAFIASIDENDPYRTSKQQQIKRWCDLYGGLFRYIFVDEELVRIVKILTDQECWQEVDSLEQVKLNRYVVGKKLIDLKREDGTKNIFDCFARYKIACFCCLEEDIRANFDELKSEIGKDDSVEALVQRCSDYGALVRFWSHKMNNQQDQLKFQYLDKSWDKESFDVKGLESAIIHRHVEALEFFWQKLQVTTNFSTEQKDQLLMGSVSWHNSNQHPNVDIVDFAIRHLDSSKYSTLLELDLTRHKYYVILYDLINNYFFDSAGKLFQSLTPKSISTEDYALLTYVILKKIPSAPDSTYVKAGYDMLAILWYDSTFKEHKQYFVETQLLDGFYISSFYRSAGAGKYMIDLIISDKGSEVLVEIINSLSDSQMQHVQKESLLAYNLFVEQKSLYNNVSNLTNGKIEKHFSSEGNNVPVLGSDQSSTLLCELDIENNSE